MPVSMPTFADRSSNWESLALDCDPVDLIRAIEDAEQDDQTDAIEGLLCGAVKQLKTQRAKPDPIIYLSLMHLSKCRDYLFMTKHVIEALCSLLKRDVKEAYKSKGNALVSLMAANVLMAALRAERQWPEVLVRVYIEDAIGERIWVDHPDAKGFVENICTAFETKIPTSNIFFSSGSTGGSKPGTSTPVNDHGRESPGPPQGGGSRSGSGSATPTRPGTDDDSMMGILSSTGEHLPINVISDPSSASTSPNPATMETVQVLPRFEAFKETIEALVLEVVREQFNRRQGADNITRNFIKFLTSASGLIDIRHLVVPKLEMWIMNPKISRPAQELLMAVSLNCRTHSAIDNEVIAAFTKFRFKNKPNVNLYLQCVRELCAAHKDNMPTLLKHTVFNELSNARNTNNMPIMAVMFNHDKELAPASLAGVFIDLLMQKECYLRALRALLREIVRYLRYDMNLHTFCVNLMQLPVRSFFKNINRWCPK
jgi:integrator complex subunit 1